MPTLSLTISRTSLSLGDLVIGTDPATGFWLPEEGVSEPEGDYRRSYMPDSRYSHGRELLGASLAPSSLPVTIYTRGASMAALAANKTALRNALGQFDYDVTYSIDGVATTYRAEPVMPNWGELRSGMVRAFLARTAVVIPLHPVAVA